MKKMIRVMAVSLALACSVCSVSLSVGAASTPESAVVSTPENSGSSKSSVSAVAPDLSNTYRISSKNIGKTLSQKNFNRSSIVINPVTNAISNVYDDNGNLIPATLSSDGHFYIIPTDDGYKMIPTGKGSAPVYATQEDANTAYANAIAAMQAKIDAQNAAYLAALR